MHSPYEICVANLLSHNFFGFAIDFKQKKRGENKFSAFFLLQYNTNQSAASLVDDTFERLGKLGTRFLRHMLELVV